MPVYGVGQNNCGQLGPDMEEERREEDEEPGDKRRRLGSPHVMWRWARVPYTEELDMDRQERVRERILAAGSDFSVVHGCRGGETSTWICGNLDHESSRFSTCISHELRELRPLRGVKIRSLACGRAHAVLTTDEGEVWSFGWNMYGQLGLGLQYDHTRTPQRLEDLRGCGAVKAACGDCFSVVMCERSVVSFGRNDCGQLGIGFASHTSISPTPQVARIPQESDSLLQDVACGGHHALAVLADGSLYAWGRNEEGQLAVGSIEPHLLPSRVTTPWRGEERAVQVACGFSHSAFLTSRGRVYCCGQGDNGQLGIGSRSNYLVPTMVLGLGGMRIGAIACGHSHTMAIDDEAKAAFSWGSNATGELGVASCDSQLQLHPQLMLGHLKEIQLTAVGCGPCARHTLVAGRECMPWQLERLLWIGVLKCEASQCLLALLPREGIASCPILIHILRLLPLRILL